MEREGIELSPAAVTPGVWEQVLAALRGEIDEESFETWVEPIRFKSRSGGDVTLAVPSLFFRNWVISNYQDQIEQQLSRLLGCDVDIRYILESVERAESHGDAKIEAVSGREAAPAPPRPFDLDRIRFNPQFTFDNYVEGHSNRFACAAAKAVAEPDRSAYNPLFLYGDVGLGKTHLLHAIGQQMLTFGSHFNVLYVSSDTFMNAFIESVQMKKSTDFRASFRDVDLLLIDDIQFFAGAERTQTQFFHIFNDLFSAGKKIVISSDVPPKDLADLEDRLCSRFESGLMVDIQPPDLETRVAILRKKAADLRMEIPGDVEIYIAERVKTNVRKLEGALNRIKEHQDQREVAGHKRETPTIASVRSLLGAFLPGEEPIKISVEKIQLEICKFFDLNLHDLTGKNRSRKFTFPRQIACFLAREMTDLSYPELARKFGGRDHTSIIHAHGKIKDDIAKDLQKQNLLKILTKIIKGESAPREDE